MADSVHKATWLLELKDLFTKNLQHADKAVEHMHGTVDSLKENLGSMIGIATGIGAAFEGIELFKDSLEEYEESQKMIAQLQAGIESTGGAAGKTLEELKEHAEKLTETIPVTGETIMDLQAQLLTFPKITGETFDQATQAVLDMSARTHHSTNELGIMLGKALQDPIKGISAMHRVGVNFSAEQTALVKHLVETGHAAEAQQIILKELASEYGGSAVAAGKTFAGQMAIMKERVRETKQQLGELVAKLITALMPVLNAVARGFKSFVEGLKEAVHWMREHREVMIAVATFIGILLGAFVAYEAVLGLIALKTAAWTALQWLLNESLIANPIGLIVTAIATLIAALVYCYEKFGAFRAVVWATWAVLKEFGMLIKDFFTGVGEVIKGTFTLDPSMIEAGADKMVATLKNASSRIVGAAKSGYAAGMKDFTDQQAANASSTNAPTEIKKIGPPGAPGADGALGKVPKAEGQKSTTINIKIEKLVGTITNNVMSGKEAAQEMTEHVAAALLSAVNNAQINAAQ